MISVENLTKSYGAQVLFENTGFKINSRERVGLVGRNGHGKTTLFRIITGEEDYDAGNVIVPGHYRIGYVRQHLDFTEDTILKEGMRGLPEAEKDHSWKVEKILSGLGFSAEDMHQPPQAFSGGYQVRLNLTKVLVSEPDLLLLDEPTNYLDLPSIRWIERFLLNWPHELILITHDRSFMDRIVTHVVGIHRRKIRKMEGDTGKYYDRIAQEEEIYEKTRVNDDKRRKEIDQFINRFRAKARLANMVQSRVKTLAKMEKREKLSALQDLGFNFVGKLFQARQMLSVRDIGFGYDPQHPLLEHFSIDVGARDRICIIGKNGKGKTTLLKLLAETLEIQSGEIRYHHDVARGIFEQTHIKTLVDSRTIEEELLYSHPDVDRQKARNISGAMMFEGEAALKKIGVLSGGEKSRVMLAKLLVTPLNLLLLDEPTNHLDMESCDALLTAIDQFPGALIMVTHNEMFLHAIAQRLIVFQNDGIDVFEGGYQEFLDKCGWADEGAETPDNASTAVRTDTDTADDQKLSKKEMRRRRSEIISERSRTLKPLEKKINAVEADIDMHETRLSQWNDAMVAASQAGDGEKIAELSKMTHQSQSDIDSLFNELEVLMEQFDKQSFLFQEQLDHLDQ